MKKILALCATVALFSGAAIVSTAEVAHAQASGPFADVPTDHWAYNAVDQLQKAGIVIGYPDGTYGGKRAMTRYEFATAIARLLPLLQPPDLSDYAKKEDLAALQSDLESKLEANQAALDALKALVTEFQAELQQLGQDVAAIKARLDALEQRVAVVEAEQRRVKINGDYSMIARSNVDTSGVGLLDQDGYLNGTNGSAAGSYANRSVFADPQVYNDFLLSITGEVSDTATAVIKLDAGNYLSTLGNSEGFSPTSDRNSTFSTVLDGSNGTSIDQSEEFSVYRAYLDAPVSLGPLGGAEAKIGRFGEQFTPFTLKAIQPDSYASVPETDTGDVTEDGIGLGLTAGSVGIQAFAAKNSSDTDSTLQAGLSADGSRSGGFLPGVDPGFGTAGIEGGGGVLTPADNYIDQSAGVRLTVGTPDTYTAGVTGLIARVDNSDLAVGTSPVDPDTGKPYNNLLVYAADYNGYIPGLESTGFTFDGEVAVSATGENSKFSSDDSTKGDEAIKAELGYTFGPVSIKGGYENVYADFAAPGYWGHVGTWTNPTNVEGGIVNVGYTIGPTIKLVADANIYKGKYNVGAANPLGNGDDLDSFDVGLKSALSSAYSLDLGYEYVYWKLANNDDVLVDSAGNFVHGAKPTEQYITIGIGHPINKNADVKVLYQIIDYDQDNTDFSSGSPTNTANQYGGVAMTQVAIHF
jgi:hypothetical protein